MVEVLHLAAVLPAGVGLCCAVGDRRGRARAAVPAAVMLAAMLAMAAGWPLVPPLVWTALLLALGVVAAARLRFGRREVAEPHVREMQVHRALGLVLGAGLLAVGSAVHGASGTGNAVHVAHAAHVVTSSPVVATLAGAAGYVAYTGWVVMRSRRRASLVGAVEASAMALMAVVMAAAPLVA